jgi:uncharacterized radical SAM superfamily protein
MRIIEFRKGQPSTVEHVNATIKPARVTLLGDDIIIGLATSAGEWRVALDRRDTRILGEILARLPDPQWTD